MIQTLSPNDFGALVNTSIMAVNETTATPFPQKMLFDDADTDCGGNLDDSDDLDDDLNDFDDNTVSDTFITVSQTTGDNCVEQFSSLQLPFYLNTRSLEQDTTSKIPNYSINFTVNRENQREEETTDTLFTAIVKKFEDSFLNAMDCVNYSDLWNQNFVTSQCDNVTAFMRLLAMFYNIDTINLHCTERLLNENSEQLVLQMQQLGRQITEDDIAIALGQKEAAPVLRETEESISGILAQEENTESTITKTLTSVAVFEPTTSDLSSKKRLSRKQKLSEIVVRAKEVLLSEKAKSHFQSIRLLASSYNSLTDCYKQEYITSEEYIKFLVFLAKTREIVLNTNILDGNKTFNQYVAKLLCKTFNIAYIDGDYSETVVIVGNNGTVTEFFNDFILWNWRLLQTTTTKRTTLKILPVQGKLLLVLIMDNRSKLPRMIYKHLSSPLTIFANSFVEKVLQDINLSVPTDFLYTVDDVDEYMFLHMGIQPPPCLKIMTRHQKALFNVVMSYLSAHQPELFRLAATGKAPSIHSMRVSNLSDNDTTASYQILAHIFRKETGAHVQLDRVPKGTAPAIVLKGDGIPGTEIFWTLTDFVTNYDVIMEHSYTSSKVALFVKEEKLVINYQR